MTSDGAHAAIERELRARAESLGYELIPLGDWALIESRTVYYSDVRKAWAVRGVGDWDDLHLTAAQACDAVRRDRTRGHTLTSETL